MRKWILLSLLLLVFSACGKKPDTVAIELLKAGDRAKALQVLEQGRTDKPELKSTRFLLFVLYEYLVSQGEPAKHEAYLQAAIGEYSWICKQEGLSADYRDMEASLKGSEKTKADYEAAYAAVYAR